MRTEKSATVTTPARDQSNTRTPKETRLPRMGKLTTLPVFLRLEGKRAIVAGGSEAAAWKAELLAAAGANVEVFAEEICAELEALAADPPAGCVTIVRETWTPRALAGATIAIGAIEDEEEGSRFAALSRLAGVPVNIVDKPELCGFQFGAIVNRSPLVIGISTGGAAPVFGQAMRARIEALLPRGFARWAQAAKEWREKIKRQGLDAAERRRFWERFTDRAESHAERAPGPDDLSALVREAFPAQPDPKPAGFVTLVGAGPGDPELLTLRAIRALRTADVILYDDLVAPAILEFARREARRMLVGKSGHGPACRQDDINRLMVGLAKAGRRVVRLKSGDPLIFGRAGEEMAALTKADIPFEIVPGISAAQGAAARLRVSLTHRDHARRVQLVTGHARDGRLPENLCWRDLSDPNVTTAIYMPRRTLSDMVVRLQQGGLPANCPAAAVLGATRPEERVVISTIADLPGQLADEPDGLPCLVLFGLALSEISDPLCGLAVPAHAVRAGPRSR